MEGKDAAYEERILDLLSETPMSLTDLSRAMGYKGITVKLSQTIEKMLAKGELMKVPDSGFGTLLQRAEGN